MLAEIISIGDELLIGQVINTNASWMAEQLNMAGIGVVQVTTIADDRNQILTTLEEAHQRADLILITGGLGPTRDDITKQTLCEYFDTQLVFNEEVYENIVKLFGKRHFKITAPNRKQAEVPAICTPFINPVGSAPGMWFEKMGKVYVSLPGVPFEMKPMMTDYVIPQIQKLYHTPVIIHKTVLTTGIGESWLADKIEPWASQLPASIKLAYLPQPGIVRLRLSATGTNKEALGQLVNKEIENLKALIDEVIFGYDTDTLEAIVGSELRKRKQRLATAESCTGGYIAHLLTSIAGSSDYFNGSVVAYSNEIKQMLLGVSAKSLEEQGAVSEAVVKEMAEGIRKKMNTDYALATSGIAGPGGGTDEKPVGTIWVALATPDNTRAKLFHMGEHRQRNIRRTALAALNMLRLELRD